MGRNGGPFGFHAWFLGNRYVHCHEHRYDRSWIRGSLQTKRKDYEGLDAGLVYNVM